MNLKIIKLLIFTIALFTEVKAQEIVWNSPSKDALDSMPLSGSLGAGANIWVQDGAIWLYLAHNGAYDENGKLLKLGCVKLIPENINLDSNGFIQSLDPQTGTITISKGNFSMSIWFSNETLIIETANSFKHKFEVAYGIWRDNQKFDINDSGFVWYHKNKEYAKDVVLMAEKQGIPENSVCDVTTNRVFGGALAVKEGLHKVTKSDVKWQLWEGYLWTGVTMPRSKHLIVVSLIASMNSNENTWQKKAKTFFNDRFRESAKKSELAKWNEFWKRSYININSDAVPTNDGYLVSQNYNLFRYMLACNRNGEFPLLFNGGIFTTDVAYDRITGMTYSFKKREGQEFPDFRRWWGTHFMSQNQRWMGWPTIAAGDVDMLKPTLEFYRKRELTARARAKTNNAEGVVYPEPMDVWGLCSVKPLPNGFCGSKHLTYHFSVMLEIGWMALQARNTMGLDITEHLEWIKGTVMFYDSFYRNETKKRTGSELDKDGMLNIYPSNALELLSGATNPIEVVCGLKRVTEGLLEIDEIKGSDREQLIEIKKHLPEIPIGERSGVKVVKEAKSFEGIHNKWEPIEMYSFWPYRYFGITQPETLKLARNTWDNIPKNRIRCINEDYSWMANVVNVSALARPEESKRRVIYKLANNKMPQARFPAFFGPGHDWIPDHNWGGSGMTGLQEMLIAPEVKESNGKIYLFPSWPKDWDVEFKLHTAENTIVECIYKNGEIKKLKVFPEIRKKDVIVCN
ncbi:hypothetical protein KFZ70_09245 [Tamlana fucoidanivorans]|uniref:DUF5703 domain-containing protein n=1 Tax=Allotamlana fucoidanivorans TaxID=2583814 RepID=A0A5C4SP57_9FLAO|nr:DUF5703 domain-containing protein [Tamlana fucoidanivorans]TNJ46062.1 hypothetical protein FGF67_03440 [Tamlana fucoidanivorans]